MGARIYLDHNATSPLCPQARDAMRACLDDLPLGNPSSPHAAGQRARMLLEESRDEVAAFLGVASEELLFTSGGTESDNHAILGRARRFERESGRGGIITSSIEHPAVLEPCAQLEREGWRVTRVGVDGAGRVDPEEVEAACDDRTALISLMAANNETGVLQPIECCARIAKERGIPFHVDAVQSAAWVRRPAAGADAVSISSHKLGGPAGVGALWLGEAFECDPLIRGGRQERARRAGTESVLAAIGFAAAARAIREDAGRAARCESLRGRLEGGVRAIAPDARIHGESAPRLPGTTSVAFPGRDQEAIVIALDLRGVALSTGSACSTGSSRPSHVLAAMGIAPEIARGTVRWSLGGSTTEAMIDAAIGALAESLAAVPAAYRGTIR